jgi:uncharacterized protein (DUF58 family)
MKGESMTKTQETVRRIAGQVRAVNLEIARGRFPLSGLGRPSPLTGTDGNDITKIAPYEPGDPVRNIDWRGSARKDDDYDIDTLHFEDPHPADIVFLIKVGKSMDVGSTGDDKRTLCAYVTATGIRSAALEDDMVHVRYFSNHKVEAKLGPKTSLSMFYPALEKLMDTSESETPAIAANTGFLQALRTLPVRRSVVIILADFINFTEEEKLALKRASGRHTINCVVLRDLREMVLPEKFGGIIPVPITLKDISTGATKTIWNTNRNRRKFTQNAEDNLEELKTFFHDARCGWAVFNTDQGVKEAIPAMMQMFAGIRGQ